MFREEFKDFMDQQIIEIEKYKETQSQSCSDFDSNKCVFEWIQNNAENFRKNWFK